MIEKHKTLQVEGIGSVTVKQSRRSRNISIRIIPGPSVVLSAPHYLSDKYVRHIIGQKKSWIQKQLLKPGITRQNYLPGDIISTLHFKLHICFKGEEILEKDYIALHMSRDIAPGTDQAQNEIKYKIREQLRKEAKAYLPQRLAWLANKNNFSYANVRIKDSKTRWGSCSVKKNINLSLYLMLLPAHLIDYIILHELCHLVHLNHGEGFHDLMKQLTNDSEKELRKELRTYRTGL